MLVRENLQCPLNYFYLIYFRRNDQESIRLILLLLLDIVMKSSYNKYFLNWQGQLKEI